MGTLMKKAERDRRAKVELLLEKARRLGINQFMLRTIVHNDIVGKVHPDNINYQALWESADRINAAGIRHQLGYLLEAYRLDGALKKLDMSGSPLDSFIQQSTASDWEPSDEADFVDPEEI